MNTMAQKYTEGTLREVLDNLAGCLLYTSDAADE